VALFEFELAPAKDITPWASDQGPNLSWFALTDGKFWMPVGKQTLFQYSDDVLTYWDTKTSTAEYQIAAFARDMLGSVAAGTARLPKRFEELVKDRERFGELQKLCGELNAKSLPRATTRLCGG